MHEIAFRLMLDADLPLVVRWRNEPHVLQWFRDPPANIAQARGRYGERLCGENPTRMWVVTRNDKPIGYVQDFPVDADDELAVRVQQPGAVGFDYLIGVPDLVGMGIGTAMLRSYLLDVLLPDYPEAEWFVACPDARNGPSLRVLEKLGFVQRQWIQMPGEEYAEIVCRAARGDLTKRLTHR